jgi:deoxyribonucleoside regulator
LEMNHSSFYQAGYVSMEDIRALQGQNLVGDICGRHFTLNGMIPDNDFHKRIMAIKPQDLMRIPKRVAIAGGEHKVLPILGALRSGMANVLITNEATARGVLENLK